MLFKLLKVARDYAEGPNAFACCVCVFFFLGGGQSPILQSLSKPQQLKQRRATLDQAIGEGLTSQSLAVKIYY